jgi:DNA-binding Lrp family transcriptional regulator
MTKPQDVLVALKLCLPNESKSFAALAKELGMSASEVHASVARLGEARLVNVTSRKVNRKPFLDFLKCGVPYVFPARLMETTRGVPTAWASGPMAKVFSKSKDNVPVWPEPEGTVKGQALEPLYPSVPFAARNDPTLYDLLSLVDALRIGRARERKFAEKQLEQRLSHG